MKYLLIVLLLASSVVAQEWVKVDASTDANYYVDKKSISKTVHDKQTFYRFDGKAETGTLVVTTSFVTSCKNYVVLYEKLETPDAIFMRQLKNPEVTAVNEGDPVASAINYVCYKTLKKDKPFGTVPETE